MTHADKTRLLAGRVMGLEVRQRECGNWQAKVYEDETKALYSWVWLGEPQSGFCRNWSPLTNLSHAGEVMEAMRAKGWTYSMGGMSNGSHMVVFYRDTFTSESAIDPLLPTAICHAALQAHEVKEEEL